MLAIGIDMIAIPRVQAVIDRHSARFLRRVYTPEEVAFCRGRVPELAARFAAKEAVMKALGVGGMPFRHIEIARLPSGKPEVRLYGRMQRRAERLGVTAIHISISHSRDNAVAVAIAELTNPDAGSRSA